jgi:hypothetical protein
MVPFRGLRHSRRRGPGEPPFGVETLPSDGWHPEDAHAPDARGGREDGFTRADLVEIGERFDVARGGGEIIDAVDSALDLWPAEAKEAGLAPEWIRSVGGHFRRFASATA